jgi:hypothetical protein
LEENDGNITTYKTVTLFHQKFLSSIKIWGIVFTHGNFCAEDWLVRGLRGAEDLLCVILREAGRLIVDR